MFEIPVKEIIVNEDTQAILLEDDGTAYADNDVVGASSGGFIIDGWLPLTLGSELVALYGNMRIIKTATSAAVAQIATYLVTSTSAVADSEFRVVAQGLDLTPTEFQNRSVEKRYQIPVNSSAATIATAIAAAINADTYAAVTASVNSATVTLTAKTAGIQFWLYSTDISGTFTVTTPAALGVGTYDHLKNINWAKNVDFDRNAEWFPRKGATYNIYYFRVKKLNADGGNLQFPSSERLSNVQDFRIYARVGTTFNTAMDLLDDDCNQ